MSGDEKAPVFSEEQREGIEPLLNNQLSECPPGDASTGNSAVATGSTPTGTTTATLRRLQEVSVSHQDSGWVALQAMSWIGLGPQGSMIGHA